MRPRPGIVAERVGDDFLLLDVDTAACSELNRTGALLWECLPATEADLVAALADRFPAAGPRAADDVRAWLQQMAGEGWVAVDG